MLKAASCVCVVAVGIFLIVTAETDTKVSGSDYYEEPSGTNFTEEALNSTIKTSEYEAGKERDSEISQEDGIKSPRIPKRRKFEEDEEIDKQSKESSDEVLRNDTISTESTVITLPYEDDPLEQNDILCSEPLEIEGAVTPDLEGTEHKVDTTISYQCHFGYISRGSVGFTSTCKIDPLTGKAQWTKPEVQCVSRSCGDPGYVPNARRIGNLFTFPNKVAYHCEEGYKLRGLRDRYCQVSGEWSGRLPTCEKIYCSVPPDPINGRVQYYSLEYGTELRYECNKGFALTNHQPRVCTYDGTWSDNEPECSEVRCKMPESPEHGSVQLLGEPKVGSIALFFCDEGATMIGTSSSKCTRDGGWTFDPPKCMSSCKVIDVENGEIGQYKSVKTYTGYGSRSRRQFLRLQVGSSVNHSETVTLQCNTGFMPPNSSTGYDDGSAQVTCIAGLWNKPILCQPKPCLGNPLPMENGDPIVKNNSHGAVIWYKCRNDFIKAKTGRVWCDYGTWKGNTPICADTRCYNDQLTFTGLQKPHGKVHKNNSVFNITCEHGYKNTGQRKMKCIAGKWNITENPCEIETCDDDPPSVLNGRPMQFNREHGSSVHYECDNGFDLVSASIVRCNAGKWEGDPPSCQEYVTMATTSRSDFGITPNALHVLPSSNPVDECFCSYDFETPYVIATVRGRKLEPEERVKQGETVSFSCSHHSLILKWQNGLRIRGTANLACNECEKLSLNEMPSCVNLDPGGSVLLYSDKMIILPGGIIKINKGDNFEVTCLNGWIHPNWYPSGVTGMLITDNSGETFRETASYGAKMHITEASYHHSGRYECFSTNARMAYSPTVLELRIVDPEIRCPELSEYTNKGSFSITYGNDRKINSAAYYTCKNQNQKLIGENTRRCLSNAQWSIPSEEYPSCEDITCTKFPLYNGLIVSYTDSQNVRSIATFRCSNQSTLVGSNSSECQPDGIWSNPRPKCEILDIRCPPLDKQGIFTIEYDNKRRINSTARFYCKGQYKKIEGCTVRTCQPNGEWSGSYPTCIDYVKCVPFEEHLGLEVAYSDGVRVGSVATFRCEPLYKLQGSPSARCRFNGTWNRPSPICEPPQCFIDDPTKTDNLISTLPTGVVADLSVLPVEYFDSVPYGTEIPLLCEDDLNHEGSKKATCGPRGKWDIGNVQCILGCRLKISTESTLLINPVKEFYRFGDMILLSCPPGQKLSSDVERAMCLGSSFSHDLPDCIEITETSPSAVRETRRST